MACARRNTRNVVARARWAWRHAHHHGTPLVLHYMGEVALLCSWLRANKTFGRKRRRGKPGCCSADNQCFGCVCAGVASQLAVSTTVCGQFAPCVRALLAYTLSREEAHACTTADSNNFARARVILGRRGLCGVTPSTIDHLHFLFCSVDRHSAAPAAVLP